ncbi:hypothetical protein [Streptomyces shenzhenensis]|uniref:hypothetical protein n=1 Tax=Streptomyces shenzhenensis TaxID=943815 RepID=UPI003F53F6C5
MPCASGRPSAPTAAAATASSMRRRPSSGPGSAPRGCSPSHGRHLAAWRPPGARSPAALAGLWATADAASGEWRQRALPRERVVLAEQCGHRTLAATVRHRGLHAGAGPRAERPAQQRRSVPPARTTATTEDVRP